MSETPELPFPVAMIGFCDLCHRNIVGVMTPGDRPFLTCPVHYCWDTLAPPRRVTAADKAALADDLEALEQIDREAQAYRAIQKMAAKSLRPLLVGCERCGAKRGEMCFRMIDSPPRPPAQGFHVERVAPRAVQA